MDKNPIKSGIIIGAIVLVFIGIYFLISNVVKDKSLEELFMGLVADE